LLYGTSTMYGFAVNWNTGEKCCLEIRCHNLGVGIAGGITANSIWIPNGPQCGKNLEGVTIGMGAEGGFGEYIGAGPGGSGGVGQNKTTSVTGGAGIGIGFSIYSSHCTTRVIFCENSPDQCQCE